MTEPGLKRKLRCPHRKTGLSVGLMRCRRMSRSDLQRRQSKGLPPEAWDLTKRGDRPKSWVGPNSINARQG